MKALLFVALLVVLLPFEPMEPLAEVAGLQVSHLELAALVLLAAALYLSFRFELFAAIEDEGPA